MNLQPLQQWMHSARVAAQQSWPLNAVPYLIDVGTGVLQARLSSTVARLMPTLALQHDTRCRRQQDLYLN